jgi:hypothetical protein
MVKSSFYSGFYLFIVASLNAEKTIFKGTKMYSKIDLKEAQ